MHAATTTVFARTADGLVRVDEGEPLPAEVTAEEVDRLLAGGAVTEVTETRKTPAASGRGKTEE